MSHWIRSAFWIGPLKTGTEERFRKHMDTALMPALRALPGVSQARALWPRLREDEPPAILCQVLVEFASRADVDRMLAAPERASMRPMVLEARAMFDGRFSHIEYEVGEP